MALDEILLEKRVTDLLQKQIPTRVVVFLRTKSPLYHLYDSETIVTKACSTLNVDTIESKAHLLTIWKWDRITIFAFDLWHNEYNWNTAHHPTDLPVLLVDYGKRISHVKIGSPEFRLQVNNFVANQHECHGWDAKPPYFQDQTGPKVPTYMNPRSITHVTENGTVERLIKTPPPE